MEARKQVCDHSGDRNRATGVEGAEIKPNVVDQNLSYDLVLEGGSDTTKITPAELLANIAINIPRNKTVILHIKIVSVSPNGHKSNIY